MSETKVTQNELVNPYKAMAHLSANQNINDATSTLIAFDTEDYDTNGDFVNTSGNYKYVAPINGYYLVSCNVTLTDAGKFVAGNMYTMKDASCIGTSSSSPYPGSTTATQFDFNFNQVVYLTAGQAISFKAYIDTSDATTGQVVGGTNGSYCSFYLLSV